MVEKINLPIKISGDTLSAIEFNQVVDKTNSLITEFNSATTLSQVTWTVGQPKPTIVADEIIGTISEGETKYVQTSTVGNQTVAILHSPNSVLTSVTQEMHVIDPTMIIGVSLLTGRYFITSDMISGGFKLKHLNLDNTISTIALGNIANPNFTVSDRTNAGILTENYLIFRDDSDSSCINVIDRETNTWNESLSVKATALLMRSDTWCGSLTYDGVNLYALVETSDNAYETDYDVNILKLDLEFNVISTRTLDTCVTNYIGIKCKNIEVIDGMLYEISHGEIESNDVLSCMRYNLITSEYDLSWGNVDINRSFSSTDFSFVSHKSFKLIKSGNDLLLLSTYPEVQGSEYDKFIKLNSTGTDVEVIAYPGSVPNEDEAGRPSGVKRISILSNTVVVIQMRMHMNLVDSLNIDVYKLVDGEFVDVSEVLLTSNIAAMFVLELENSRLAVFGSYYSEMSAAFINRETPTTYVIITDLSLNPNITVTTVSDYYAKALDYYQAIVSPSDIYIPEDLRTSYVSSMMAVNGSIYKYNNETEELVILEVPGLATAFGFNVFNDLIQLNVGELQYTLYGVNEDLSVTDLTSWFTQQELDGLDISAACYINGAIYSTSVTPDVNGNYMITKRTATDVTTLSLQIVMTNPSGMTEIRMQKLDANHIALWNSFVEPPMRMFIVDAILEIGDSVTFTTYTTLGNDQEIYQLSINWMHDYPNIAGMSSQGVIFPSDAVSQVYTDIVTPISALVGESSWNLHDILDSEDRKIAMLVVGEEIGVFDFDTMSPIEVAFTEVIYPDPISSQVGNILHQKSDGTFMYFRPNSGQVFTSSDLATWTLITPTMADNKK